MDPIQLSKHSSDMCHGLDCKHTARMKRGPELARNKSMMEPGFKHGPESERERPGVPSSSVAVAQRREISLKQEEFVKTLKKAVRLLPLGEEHTGQV